MSTNFVLITGMPGTGKTTLVKRLTNQLMTTHNRLSGFYTEEVRNATGNRIGFDIVTLDGTERGVLARSDKSCYNSKHKVGNYSVDTSSVDAFLLPIYQRRTADILVIDEIGKMELKSAFFAKFISELIGSGEVKDQCPYKIVVATVPVVTTIPIVQQIKSIRNGKLFTVTKLNRNEIYDEVEKTVADILSRGVES